MDYENKTKNQNPPEEESSSKISDAETQKSSTSATHTEVRNSQKNLMEVNLNSEDEDRLLTETDMETDSGESKEDAEIRDLISKIKTKNLRLATSHRKKLKALRNAGEGKTQEQVQDCIKALKEILDKPAAGKTEEQESTKRPRASDSTPSPALKQTKKLKKDTEASKSKMSFKEATEGVKMVIVPKDFPTGKLTEEQSNKILDALDAKMVAEETQAQFLFSKHENEALILLCANTITANWLQKSTPAIKPWEGADLIAGEAKDILKRTKLLLFVPDRHKEEETETILRRIDNQNACLNARKSWKVVNRNKEGKSQTIILSVPEEDAEVLKSRKFKIFLGFTQATLRDLGKPRNEGSSSKPTPQ